MTTEAQGYENAWQAHLRSARYWEKLEHRPEEPEAGLRWKFEEEGRLSERLGREERRRVREELGTPPPPEDLRTLIASAVVQALREAPPVRHIHQHGAALPPALPPKSGAKQKSQAIDL